MPDNKLSTRDTAVNKGTVFMELTVARREKTDRLAFRLVLIR